LKRGVVDAVKYMDGRGLNYSGAGSVSVRVGADRILITPSGAVKSAMTPGI
jgi:ribulose-5-phosphate 4-epimerase/fuculose-1-phosphate aldolase